VPSTPLHVDDLRHVGVAPPLPHMHRVNPPNDLTVTLENRAATTALVYPPSKDDRTSTLVLAHGAGAGQRSTFMVNAARAIASLGVRVVTFNFLYTEQRRRIPDRAPVLESCYRAVIDLVGSKFDDSPIFIGGKSMGGRIATQVAASDPTLPIAGIVLLGYPLHPPGRSLERRDKHLPAIVRPMLFVQGSRDAFGTPPELTPIVESLGPSRAMLHVVEGGDHSFKVGRADTTKQTAVFADVYRTVAKWIQQVSSITSPSRLKP
jgi:predicted alpha/beta-hydrolase family hydrolase